MIFDLGKSVRSGPHQICQSNPNSAGDCYRIQKGAPAKKFSERCPCKEIEIVHKPLMHGTNCIELLIEVGHGYNCISLERAGFFYNCDLDGHSPEVSCRNLAYEEHPCNLSNIVIKIFVQHCHKIFCPTLS